MTPLIRSLLERLSQLPEPLQDHFVKRFLQELENAKVQTEAKPHKRVAGLGKGTMVISDDFDAPLPESFWLDET